MDAWFKLSVRVRLILLFVVIKVVPLLLLTWIAWYQTQETTRTLGENIQSLVETADGAIRDAGDTAVSDAVAALDARAREEIERLTTDTANRVAEFLYERDADILHAATLSPNAEAYRDFIDKKRRNLIVHGKWRLNAAQTDWEPETPRPEDKSTAEPGSPDNAKYFHYRRPLFFQTEKRPLYLEMSFIGLDGREQVKVTSSSQIDPELKNVAQRQNTYARAETYFPDLQRLKPGEIYVSEVIGRYVGTRIIGKFTPEAARQRGIPFAPEEHAYAGRENPAGKRFRGIIRWAAPVTRGGQVIGWVTLALDHDHLMSFTDTITPAEARYQDINDAFDGNYAFIWDYKGRSIVHPRHHSIVGYDENGEPEVPWLEESIFAAWQKSGKRWADYMAVAPTFVEQLQRKKPAAILTERGNVGLDCRYLNFAPQCRGWYNLAEHGGSGSFLILWSGVWKLTTTAAIPYHTGRYAPKAAGNQRGFGIVTIGANLEDFHKATSVSRARLNSIIQGANQRMSAQGNLARQSLQADMRAMLLRLAFSTIALVIVVIVIAVRMASYLSRQLAWLNDGFHRFREGEKEFRFNIPYRDEITSLASSFNELAETLNRNVAELKREITVRAKTEAELRDIQEHLEIRIDERTRELSETNARLSEEVQIRRTAEEKAHYLAGHDPLTGLANRKLFNEQLQKALFQCRRSGKYGALLFLDLDRFKKTNDTLGHAAGDALLVHMAQTLQKRIRMTDTAARLGGDEFAVIMTEIDHPQNASVLAKAILEKLKEPVNLGNYEMFMRTSIGIATFGGGNDEAGGAEEIIRHADMAMYQAKSEGGMRFKFFGEGLEVGERLEEALPRAIANREFLPYFQPLYHAVERRVLYLEVLARWQHTDQGLLLPERFMEIARKSSHMEAIDEIVFDLACAEAQKWRAAGLSFGRISLNILPQSLENPGFVKTVETMLAVYQLPCENLAFEISEYALLNHSPEAAATLQALRGKGIEILVDRLEIERSSLRSLTEYAVDAIKINRAFTARIGNPETDAMISTIAAIANAIHMRLIAEGVESEAQWNFYTSLHCDIIQGYKHARPMSAEDTRAYLEHHAQTKNSPKPDADA
ncbi:MAG: EAL domain-containing protein [Zoogloeaceae bacterium]|jgi:diguanylate cyclase (GGDEF)-like protein|nr:EAL domain-containing protein [Zoogloeaceae bacterium]